MRLAAIAEDRLAYQEYVDSRDAIDKSITALYSKLQKKDGPKVNKKKKQKGVDAPNGTPALTGTAALPPCPAALGLSPDEHNMLQLPDQLNELVRTRQKWVDNVGGVFEEKEREAEKLFVLFDRLEKTGAIPKESNPIRQAIQRGKLG